MIHKEGYQTLAVVAFGLVVLVGGIVLLLKPPLWLSLILTILALTFFSLILFFFRFPKRKANISDVEINSPADGKVVAIEKVTEQEYFNDKRIQVSVFMSPLNVHLNWFPVGGIVKYIKYHKGKYLVAWHPKSSTENERQTVVIEHPAGEEILVRQIAGAVARRIVCYAKKGQNVSQNDHLGFIKFGSRLDIFLPQNSKIVAQLGEKVTAGQSVIAKLSE